MSYKTPHPLNEPVRPYAPGDATRESIKARLDSMAKEKLDVPCLIGGREIRTGKTVTLSMPHSNGEALGKAHLGGAVELEQAVASALKAKPSWEAMPSHERAAIFLKAAELLASVFRDELNASTMLCQSKSVYQAEIDAACEMIDFFRFNSFFYEQIQEDQPISGPGTWNRMDYRPLEGFVTAITPFNFTSIAGNLPAAPALLGNTVVWKPATTQLHSAWKLMELFKAAGLPDGVINFVPCEGTVLSQVVLRHKEMAGVHFTGSTKTFQTIYKTVGENIANYRGYPRLVGETGGKDFVFAHASADVSALATALVRGAFEYQGQKCSAASRAYIPKSLWPKVREIVCEQLRSIKMGDVRDFSCFVNAVIDQSSYDKITGAVNVARKEGAEVVAGGGASLEKGFFIEPTVLLTSNPKSLTMTEELFGPVLTVFVYNDSRPEDFEETLRICDSTSPYALTGAIFAQDHGALMHMSRVLRHAAGNFYINDKPTGAVVGQQPFGGARASGTNDKAGSKLNLLRWTSPRTIKETFSPPHDYKYPFLN